MRAAVTGAAGFLGNNLCRALLLRGHRVRALVHQRRDALEGLAVEVIEGELADRDALDRLVASCEVVFHLAARISLAPWQRDALHTTNVLGTRAVIDACVRARARLVHVSSIHALAARPSERVLDETSPAADTEQPYYDQSKAEGEREVRSGMARGLAAVIVNPTALIGPHDYGPSQMGQLFADLYRGKIPAVVEGGFVWVDVRDVAAQLVAIGEARPPSDRYLLPGHHATLLELAGRIAQISGGRGTRRTLPGWLASALAPLAEGAARLTGGEPALSRASLAVLLHHQHVDGSRAARELGFAPRPLQTTLEDLIADLQRRQIVA